MDGSGRGASQTILHESGSAVRRAKNRRRGHFRRVAPRRYYLGGGMNREMASHLGGERVTVQTRRTVRFRPAIDPPWLDVPALPLGAAAAGRGTPDLYALVSRASAPEYRLDLYADGTEQSYVCHQALFVERLLVLGFGEAVFVVPWPPGEPRTVRLRSYFVSLHRAADAVYVASGEDVTRLDLDGKVLWTSPQLGIDGVRIELINDDVITGEAEHDPAGDWRPFRLRASDGRPF
jgi:hypothetical protein